MGFLTKLVALIRLKEASSSEHSEEPGQAAVAHQTHLDKHAPLLGFAANNFAQLTAESRQLFPSDMTKSSMKNL